MEFELLTVGDAVFVSRVLNGTAMLHNEGTFQALAAIGFLVGLFAVAIKGIQSQKLDMGGWAAGLVVYMVMFWPTADVMVMDATPAMGRDTEQTIRVDNVPVGVAAMGWVVSSVSSALRERMLMAFSAPGLSEGLQASDGSTTRAIEAIAAIRHMSDPEKQSLVWDRNYELRVMMMNLRAFIQRCTELEMQASSSRLAKFMSSPDPMDPTTGLGSNELWIGVDQWSVQEVNGTPEVLMAPMSCKAASDSLRAQLRSQGLIDAVKKALGPMMALDSGDFDATWASAQALLVRSAQDGYAGDAVLGATVSQSMQRYVVAHVVGGALKKTVAADGGNQMMALNIVLGDAIAQRNTQWVLEESMFLQMARPISAFFESMVYVCAPFMAFALGLGSFGLTLTMRYGLLTLWVMLWGPTMAAINLFQVTMAESAFKATMKGTGEVVDVGSLAGSVQIMEDAESWIAIGSMMMASTPAITLMLLFGSAMTAVGLANRLQSADTIGEKNASPDAVGTAAGVGVGSAFQGSFGLATSNARMNALPSISLGGDQSIQQASSVREAREAVSGFTSDEQRALGNQLRMDRQAGVRGTEAGESRQSLENHASIGASFSQGERFNRMSAAQKHLAVENALSGGVGATVDGAMLAGGVAGMARGAAARGAGGAAARGAGGKPAPLPKDATPEQRAAHDSAMQSHQGAQQVAGSTGIPIHGEYRSGDMSRAEVREAMEVGRAMAAEAKQNEELKAGLGRAAVSRLEEFQAATGSRSDTADSRSALIAQNQDVARAADTFDQADAYRANFGTQQTLTPDRYIGALQSLGQEQFGRFQEQAAQLGGFGGAMQATSDALKGMDPYMTSGQRQAAAFAMVLSGSSNFPGGRLDDADQAAGRLLLAEALTQGGLAVSPDRALGGQGDATRFEGGGERAREGAQDVQARTEAAIAEGPQLKSRDAISGEISAVEARAEGAGAAGGAAGAEAGQLTNKNLLDTLTGSPEAGALLASFNGSAEQVQAAAGAYRQLRDAITADHAFSGLGVEDQASLLMLGSKFNADSMRGGDGDGDGNPKFEERKQQYMDGIGGAGALSENVATVMAFLDAAETGLTGSGFGQYDDKNLAAPEIRSAGAVNDAQLQQAQNAIANMTPAEETQLGEAMEAFGYQSSTMQVISPVGGALDALGITPDNPLGNPSGDGDYGPVGTGNDGPTSQDEGPANRWGGDS